MKVVRTDFSKFRNNEHFQYQKELSTLFEQIDPDALRIDTLVKRHRELFKSEDEAFLKITKNTFSQARNEADVERDRIFRGFDDTIKAALNHYDLGLRNNAVRIRIPVDTYGNLAQLPLNEETSAIYNLIQELRNNFADDVSVLDLNPWLDALEMKNAHYEELVQSGYEEDAVKTELKMKEVRTEVDIVVRQLFDRIEALMMIDGEESYVDFVKRLNLITEKYNIIIAQRQGRNAAKDEETDETIEN